MKLGIVPLARRPFLLVLAAALLVLPGSAVAGVNDETVASVNGDRITCLDLRESLGLWGGAISASGIPLEKKKEALDRLIDGRLLEHAARAKKWDQQDEYLRRVREGEGRLLIPVLFRVEIASRLKIDPAEIRAESARLRKADKKLAKETSLAMAKGTIWQREIQKIEQEVVSAAREEASVKIDKDTIERIGKGETVEDNVVLGTSAAGAMSYGEIKVLLRRMSAGKNGGQDLAANPKALREIVDRELTGRALLAYAQNRKVEESEWMNTARRELERSILIDLFTEKEILKGVKVTEKEIGDTYARHSQMLVQDGKKVPLSDVREDIRRIVLADKKKKAIFSYLEKMKKKAKIKVNEKVLQKA